MWPSFDMGAVLHALPDDRFRLLAGADGLGRAVHADPDGAEDELLVTSEAELARRGGDWDGIIAALDRSGVAGVLLQLAGDELPDGLRAAADRHRVPVVVFPLSVSLAEARAVVLRVLLETQRQRFERLLDVHQRFTRIVLAGGGAAEVATALHEILDCTVAVLDPDGRALVVVPPDAGDVAAEEAGVRHAIRVGEQEYGAIVAWRAAGTMPEDAAVAVERAAMAVAMRQAQAAAVAAGEERFAALTLEELISGHASSAADAAERAASFGWDLSRPRAVLLASVDPPVEASVLPRALGTIAAAARATLGPNAIVWTRSATIAALVAPATDEPAERRRLAEALRAELDARLQIATVSIGVGRRVDDLAELSRSYVEASRAVDVGRWAKGRHVTEVFDELGLERLLAATPPEELAEFVRHTIGALHEHDETHGTQLVATLAVWLETRNMAEAARRMHVHYNTLKNRLERIEAIVGPVLSDGARALECEVAIHVARHYDVPWG